MAGSGRRVFQPGEVLTASNVMNYLQDQAVQVYAGTAARGSAIGTAVSEGMVSYLNDNNFVQVYDGSGWRSLAGVQVANGTAVRDALLPSPIQGDAVFRTDLGELETYYAAYNSSTNKGGITPAGWYRTGNGAAAYATYTSTSSQSWPAGYITPSATPTFNFGSSNYATYFSARAAGINLPIRGAYFMRFSINATAPLLNRNFIELAGSNVTIPGSQRAGSGGDDAITGTAIVYSDGGASAYVTMQGWQDTGTVVLSGFSIQAIYLGNRSE